MKRLLFVPLVILSPALFAASIIDAAKEGDKLVLRTLLQKKADVNATDPDGSTALHWASCRDDLGKRRFVVDFLVGKGATPGTGFGVRGRGRAADR